MYGHNFTHHAPPRPGRRLPGDVEDFPEAPSILRLSMSVRMYLDGMPCLVIDPAKKKLRYDPSREGELMRFYEQVLSEDLDSFTMSPQYAPAFYVMLEALKNACPPDFSLVHTHAGETGKRNGASDQRGNR